MDKLKQSSEAILKLGKKITNELLLNNRVDTLGRWMAHYIADLIDRVENTNDETQSELYKRECFNVILALWNRKENIPFISKPLENFEIPLKLLDKLKADKFNYDYFRYFNEIPKDIDWCEFVQIVKKNTESIFEICMFAVINKDVIDNEVMWTEQYGEFLSDKEKSVINHFASIYNKKEQCQTTKANEIEPTSNEIMVNLLNKVSFLLEEQNTYLNLLKTRLINKPIKSKRK